MASTPREYIRLPGAGMRRDQFFTALSVRCRLYLGKDHLLSVDQQAFSFSEEYKRFYFRDIQALVICKTRNGAFGNMALCIPIGGSICGIIASSDDGAKIAWSISAAFWLLFLIVNTISGPTCSCHLRTAVQTDELPSLRRLRRAQKVIARLRPLIAEAQGGELERDQIPAMVARLAADGSVDIPPFVSAAGIAPPARTEPEPAIIEPAQAAAPTTANESVPNPPAEAVPNPPAASIPNPPGVSLPNPPPEPV